MHTPALQVSVVHGFVSAQLPHAAPPLPQTLALVVPGWQVVPSQQPVQHAPPWHLPAPFAQLVPGVAADAVHVPLLQLPIMHSLPVLQSAQVAPPLPQVEHQSPQSRRCHSNNRCSNRH